MKTPNKTYKKSQLLQVIEKCASLRGISGNILINLFLKTLIIKSLKLTLQHREHD